MSVAGVFPTVACDFVGASDAAGGEHDCLGAKDFKSPSLALVTKRANDAIAIFQQRKNRVFHVNADALMDAEILERANHFETGTIPDVRKSRVFVPAKIPLQNPAVFCSI